MPSGLLSNPGAFLEQDEQELQALKLKRKTFGVSRFWTRSSRSGGSRVSFLAILMIRRWSHPCHFDGWYCPTDDKIADMEHSSKAKIGVLMVIP